MKMLGPAGLRVGCLSAIRFFSDRQVRNPEATDSVRLEPWGSVRRVVEDVAEE